MLRLVVGTRGLCLGVPRATNVFSSPSPSTGRTFYKEYTTRQPYKALNRWEDVAKPAFQAFLKNNSHLMIPVRFRVPFDNSKWPEASWGYALGPHATWLRKQYRETQLRNVPESIVGDLDDMQFAYDWSQYKWDHYFMPGLRRFYEIYGHTDVPQGFQIPENDDRWPQRLWNFKLANRVSNIRSRGYFAKQVEQNAEELNQMDFCLDLSWHARDWRDKLLPALKTHSEVFGHCNVPRQFVVPNSEPWPKAAWGVALGVLINNMRNNKYYSEQVAEDRAELDAIGFVWDHYEATWNKSIFPALQTYSDLNGHCKVPKAFIVPAEKPWPEATHDIKLGIVMVNVRCYGYYFDQTARNVDELDDMGFELLIPQVKWDQRVEPLLKVFKEVYGHDDVPYDFVVPSEEPWDASSWGIQLGKLKLK